MDLVRRSGGTSSRAHARSRRGRVARGPGSREAPRNTAHVGPTHQFSQAPCENANQRAPRAPVGVAAGDTPGRRRGRLPSGASATGCVRSRVGPDVATPQRPEADRGPQALPPADLVRHRPALGVDRLPVRRRRGRLGRARAEDEAVRAAGQRAGLAGHDADRLLAPGDGGPERHGLAQVAGVVDELAPGARRNGPRPTSALRRRCRRHALRPTTAPSSSATSEQRAADVGHHDARPTPGGRRSGRPRPRRPSCGWPCAP